MPESKSEEWRGKYPDGSPRPALGTEPLNFGGSYERGLGLALSDVYVRIKPSFPETELYTKEELEELRRDLIRALSAIDLAIMDGETCLKKLRK